MPPRSAANERMMFFDMFIVLFDVDRMGDYIFGQVRMSPVAASQIRLPHLSIQVDRNGISASLVHWYTHYSTISWRTVWTV